MRVFRSRDLFYCFQWNPHTENRDPIQGRYGNQENNHIGHIEHIPAWAGPPGARPTFSIVSLFSCFLFSICSYFPYVPDFLYCHEFIVVVSVLYFHFLLQAPPERLNEFIFHILLYRKHMLLHEIHILSYRPVFCMGFRVVVYTSCAPRWHAAQAAYGLISWYIPMI